MTRSSMVRASLILLAVVLVAAQEGGDPAVRDPAELVDGVVVVCPVDSLIDDSVTIIVERAVEKAVEYGANAKAIVFVIDTPGGRVDSCLDITEIIVGAPCPTIAYVEGMGAISAGAVIAFACNDIITSETAPIGAVQPVTMSTEGALPTGEKEVSFLRATVAALAEANGHNPDIGLAMVDVDVELVAYPREDGTFRVVATGQFAEPDFSEQERPPVDPVQETVDDLVESLPEPLGDIARQVVDQSQPEAPGAEPPPDDEAELTRTPDGGYVILERGKLLTLRPSQALKYGVSSAICATLDEALAMHNLENVPREKIEPTWSEQLFRLLISPTVSSLLLMVGIGGLYFELKTPGFGVAGTIAIICLALFFGARAVVGLSEWIELALIALGVGLLLLEIFVIPGFGIAGVAGIVCILAGVYLSFTKVPIPQYSWEFDRLKEAAQVVSVGSVMGIILIVAILKTFPHTPLYNATVLQRALHAADGYVVQSEKACREAIGLRGTAASKLRPAGRARFGDKTIQVVSRGEFIDKGTPVVVIQVDGNRYVVDKAEEDA
jgi:membrane-bound serine protease (ClpP class)